MKSFLFVKYHCVLNSIRCFFVCLLVWSFSSHSRIFHSFGDDTIAGEGLQILTYAQHLWPLSSGGSLACHTYCDTGFPFIIVTPRTCDTDTLCRAFSSGADTTFFNDLGLSQLGFEHQTFRLRGQRSNPLRHRRCRIRCNTSVGKFVLHLLELSFDLYIIYSYIHLV